MTAKMHVAFLLAAAGAASLALSLATAPSPSMAMAMWLPVAMLLAGTGLLLSRASPPPAPPDHAARRDGDGRRGWLEAILADLSEGVVVCGADHRVILANGAAQRVMGLPEPLMPGRPLFALLSRAPILHALDMLELRRRSGEPAQPQPFVCATADAGTLLRGQLTLVSLADGKNGPDGENGSDGPTYALTLNDAGHEAALLAQDNALRKAITRELRGPLANLRAAAETIAAYPDMQPRERGAFDEVITDEAAVLSARLHTLETAFRHSREGRTSHCDIHSMDLFACLTRVSARTLGVLLTPVGIPLWLRGDSHALLLALAHMIGRVKGATGARSFDVEALLHDTRVYVDVIWRGKPLPASEVESWMQDELDGAPGRETLRDVLDRHGSEPWSQARARGLAVLRVPLPAPSRPQVVAAELRPALPAAAPDPSVLRAHAPPPALGSRRLAELELVAVATHAVDGQLVALGAVRVCGRRVLSAEVFDRLVKPPRPLSATPATGRPAVTADMVRAKPPLSVVLPQFELFCRGAVLASHASAADLGRLEAGSGPLPNTVLDTALLARLAEPDCDSGLDAVAFRLGVEGGPRRTALDDAMVVAEVLARLMDRLEAKGLDTLGQVLDASVAAALRQTEG